MSSCGSANSEANFNINHAIIKLIKIEKFYSFRQNLLNNVKCRFITSMSQQDRWTREAVTVRTRSALKQLR